MEEFVELLLKGLMLEKGFTVDKEEKIETVKPFEGLSLVIDVETNDMVVPELGIEWEDQPYPIQLACELMKEDKVVQGLNVYIDWGDIKIDSKALEVHGIDKEKIKRLGVSPDEAFELFKQLSSQADRIVGHNVEFDLFVMEVMYHRLNKPFDLRKKELVCTMLSLVDVLKLPGRSGYKWPKLKEAYEKLIGGTYGAHDAFEDVMACRKVYIWMLDNGIKI